MPVDLLEGFSLALLESFEQLAPLDEERHVLTPSLLTWGSKVLIDLANVNLFSRIQVR
jgi:hypothetical protein